MDNYRILSLDMSADENNEAISDVYSTANWAIFFMYKLFSICHCCHTTADEVSSFVTPTNPPPLYQINSNICLLFYF